MPTENRSSNTEMVSVPEGFMLVERSIWTEQQVEAATACITRLKGVPGMRDCDLAMAAIDAAQCKAPEITLADLLPAEQHQGEPVVLPARKAHHLDPSFLPDGDKGWNACLDEIAKLGTLYTHADPGEVERLRAELGEVKGEYDRSANKVAALHAQLSELEALHGGELGLPKEGWPEYHKRKMESLRDLTAGFYERKLAERDSLLSRMANFPEMTVLHFEDAIKKLLSASAEPSAPVDADFDPRECRKCGSLTAEECKAGGCWFERGSSALVERDERAAFERAVRVEWPQAPISRKRDLLPKDDPCYGDYCDEPLQRAWVGWQMRATLERKPS